MVTLLLGAHGHGKSTYIMEKIKEDYLAKKRSYLIVPEQQTLISERELTLALPPQAQLYTEATNLTRLADSVFRKTGGLKYNYITKSGQNLLMYRALCESRELLSQYKIKKGKERSCIKLFLQAVGELKTYGHTVESIERSVAELENESLKDRLSDLITVWATYERLLRESYDDPYENLVMLEKKLGECAFFENTNVYIDSFYGFTKSQLDVIIRILEKADNVTIALDCPADADEYSIQYKKIVRTRDKILGICKKHRQLVEIKSFDVDYKHESEELKYICDRLWDFSAPAREPEGFVNLALAMDEFQECEYVCSKIKELILKGSRYKDIAIIARNTDTYQGIIDFTLDKYDIPYYLSSPAVLMSKPVIKMIFSALNAINGYRQEDIIAYAKCGYTDIDVESLYALEAYMYKWSISGKRFKSPDYWSANPDGFVKETTVEQIEQLGKIVSAKDDIIKKLSIIEEPFAKGQTVSACAQALYAFLTEHRVIEKLNQEIKSESGQGAQELSQVWGVLVSSLDLIVDICGDAVCDIDTFSALLSYAMMDAKIGSIPTGEDIVTIADASLVRAKNIRHVFVLGANEGVFPAAVKDNSFFSDSDKIALETVQVDLSSTTQEQGDDELLFFKNSLSAASQTVTVTALKKNLKGEVMDKSLGFTRLEALLKGYTPVDVDSLPTLDKLYTEKIATELFGSMTGELREAVRQAADPQEQSPGFTITSDSISEELAEELYGKQMLLSSSRLERFAKCHFNFYCSEFLKLRDFKRIQFTYNDIGSLVHKIFEHFLILDKSEEKEYARGELAEIVERLTDEYTRELCGVHGVSSKMKHYFGRLKSTICVFVEALLKEKHASAFSPELFELKIHGKDSPTHLEIPVDENHTAILRGYADRVDICRAYADDTDGGTTYVKIVDYKTGSHTFKRAKLENGLDLQMLIYLLAITKMKTSDLKNKLLGGTEDIKPAGVVYLTYNINKTSVDREPDFSDPAVIEAEHASIEGKISRSGLELNNPAILSGEDKYNLTKGSQIPRDEFDVIFDQVKASVASIATKMLSGAAYAEPLKGETPCNYCKHKAICRRRDA